MKKVKQIGLSSLKLLGLIILVVNLNSLPTRFLLLGQEAPIFLEILLVALYLVGFFFIIRALWRSYQKYLTIEQKELKFSWKDVGYAFLFFLAGRILVIIGSLLNLYLSGQEMSANDMSIQMIGGQMSMAHPLFSFLFLATIVFLAPLVEELVFRGFGNVLFFKKSVSWLGALVTSLIFALLHVSSWTELPTYLVLGLIIYAAYARRGSIKDSILVHVLNNIPMAILLLLSLFF